MRYDTMEKYRTGRNEEGHDQFSIPLSADEDGFFGRECPNDDCDTKYFKIGSKIPDGAPETAESISQAELTCPYCGTVENIQRFFTEAQVEWLKSMLFRDVHKAFGDMLERAIGPQKPSGGFISVSMKLKRGALPSVRHYVEEKLKEEVSCDKCGFEYAVYGVSFHCPLCGKGSLAQHLRNSAATIRVLAEESNRIADEHGRAVADRLLGNAIEDVVSLFEGFMKHLYRYAVRKKQPKPEADRSIQKIRTNFQRLSGAEEFFRNDLGIEIFSGTDSKNREALESTFAKRHVLTHNLGLVDEKYRNQARAWERLGAELTVSQAEVMSALELVTEVVGRSIDLILPD
jgi:predicted RNA-binding Zn-ribbon protein involved in translation (DUF1610 family)